MGHGEARKPSPCPFAAVELVAVVELVMDLKCLAFSLGPHLSGRPYLVTWRIWMKSKRLVAALALAGGSLGVFGEPASALTCTVPDPDPTGTSASVSRDQNSTTINVTPPNTGTPTCSP